MDEKDIKAAIKHKNALVKKGFVKGRVAFYGQVYEDGSYEANYNNACHAGLMGLRNKLKPVAILNTIQRVNMSDEDTAKKFLEWLLNYSPYHETFYSKDPEQVLKEGVMISDTNTPANRMVGGLVANRLISEYVTLANTWEAFVKNGVHPSIAYLYAHLCPGTRGGSISYQPHSAHTAIHGNEITENYILNFLQNIGRDDPIYSEWKTYGGLSKTWNFNHVDGKKYTAIKKMMEVLTELAKSTKNKNNPFAAAAAPAKSVPFQKGIDAVSEILLTGYKGVIA